LGLEISFFNFFEKGLKMSSIRFGRLIGIVLCLTLFFGIQNTFGAKKTAEDYFNEGKSFYQKKEYEKAISAYNKAIKLNPKLVKAYNNRGIAILVTGLYEKAIADFTKAIELNPKYGKAYNNRAVAYWFQGQLDKAREDIKKAQSLGIKINPEMLKHFQDQPSP
jgi:tetratricopeptide (TPR) repeat protein